jgi:hypothetical protein
VPVCGFTNDLDILKSADGRANAPAYCLVIVYDHYFQRLVPQFLVLPRCPHPVFVIE